MPDPVFGAVVSAAPAVFKLAMPKLLGRVANELKDMGADIHHAVFNAFDKYTKTVYEKHSYFSSLVFPNQQIKLKDFYLPLTLVVPSAEGDKSCLIDDFPINLISEKKDLLIVDQAGMGKSTLLKFMFLRSAERDLGIPVFLELRKLKPSESILDYVFNQLKALDGSLDESLVVRLVTSGEFIFFLDGFDEILDSDREKVTERLKDFKRLANKNRFLLSSRDQVGLAALSDFFRVTIRLLTPDEATALIRKYSVNSELGEALVEKLASPESAPIQEFLTNPLLVSLLFKAYEHKHTIPLKKHIFYRQVFDALFENHDLSKEAGELNRKKLSGLDIYSFDEVLRAVGFLSLESGKVEYPKDEFLRLIERAQKLSIGIDFNPQALLQDLVSRVPLFVVDGNYYRWNHKSIQEYFAALYLSEGGSDRQNEVLTAMYKSEKATSYTNFFSLFADLDVAGFRQIFMPLILSELLDEFKTFPALNNIPTKSQDIRKGLCIFRHRVLFNETSESFKKLLMPINDTNPELGKYINSNLFQLAKDKLTEVGIKLNMNHGSYSNGNPLIVNFLTVRYPVIIQNIPLLPSKIVRIEPESHLTVQADGTKDLFEGNAHLPIGLTAFTPDASSPLNQPAVFDEINRMLSLVGVNIVLAEQKAQELLDQLHIERGDQSKQKFNF